MIIASLLAATLLSLDGAWELSYRDQQEGTSWKSLPAHVPGDVTIDLERAGLIPDPLVGTNVFALLPWERCEWRYVKHFPKIEPPAGHRLNLVFGGVDTRAEYFLNGERLGASENMFVPVSFDITGALEDENELVVRIRSALRDPQKPLGVLGRSRMGGTDVEGIRKAQHSFGWDIMPRLVSCGLWQSVTLESVPPIRFADVHWMTREVNEKAKTARVTVDCRVLAPWKLLHAAKLRFTLQRGEQVAMTHVSTLHALQTRDTITVPNAELWWPRDAGEPALYDARVELVDAEDRVLATDERKIGLRTITLERADWYSTRQPGTFAFRINGERVYMHGCDVTPMDALHARDTQHLARCTAMLVDLNCNMVRVWGGGVYESEAFYDFCDANGILVWQDFMMGNVEPEQNDDFARTINDETKNVVMRLRSHPCLAMWCANNEIDRSVGGDWGAFAPDPEKERISREILPRVLRDFDPLTPYLPSSPWWTPAVVSGTAQLSQDHLWGPRQKHFTGDYWCNNTPTFVSEMGCHGCPSVASLEKMMTRDTLYPWPDKTQKKKFNAAWCCKATTSYPDQATSGSCRNSLMTDQVLNHFGAVPDDLPSFVARSQHYQALALKTWIELFRSRKGRTWGLLWWNLRDGWPIISDGVVDYYYNKKAAYAAIKTAQQSVLVAVVRDPDLKAVAVNDLRRAVKVNAKLTARANGRVLLQREVTVPANGVAPLGDLPENFTGEIDIAYTADGKAHANTYEARTEIKAMCWNIFQCWGWKDRISYRVMQPGELAALPDIAEVIRAEKPSWIALQEIACNAQHAGFVDQPARLATETDMHVTFAAGNGATNGWGNALLSVRKPKSTRILKLVSTDSPRSAIIAEFEGYYVMATHFPLTPEHCLASAELICREVQTLAHEKPVFLAGDLNSSPDEPAIAKLREAFTPLSANLPTFPSHAPAQRIDYIMLDNAHAAQFHIDDARALTTTSDLSDHIPLAIRIRTR